MNANTIERNPFPGLRPFREDEEYLFFGRESQVDSMVDKLAANRFLAVVGGSGSGKSSIVNSGLRPALRAGLMTSAGTSWRIAQFRPGGDPMRAMARALAEDGVLFTGRQDSALPMEDVVDTSLRMSKIGLIDIYEQARLGEDVNLLVVVDQFEELFRYRQLESGGKEGWFGVSEEATEFVNLLLAAASQTKRPIYVVITMRSDFLGDCAQFTGLAEAINTGQYLVPRMTRNERRSAIAGPIGVGGAEISPVLLTRLVNDVGDNPDQLSILQHALNRTWARWRYEGGGKVPLDLPHYEAIGTMAHALDRHAEKAFQELGSERQQLISEKIFKALTDKATDARGVRRPTKMGELCALADASADEVTEVIDVFRQPSRSFLMPPAGEELRADTVIDISHESLMRVWARLNGWADEEAQSAHIYRRLAETSVLYADGKAGLWRDPDLQVALGWRERNLPNEIWAQRYHSEFDSAMGFLNKSKVRRGRRRVLALGSAAVIFLFMSVALVAALTSRSNEKIAAKKAQILLGDVRSAQMTIEFAKLEKEKLERKQIEAGVALENAKQAARAVELEAKQKDAGAKKSVLDAKAAANEAMIAKQEALDVATMAGDKAKFAREKAKVSEEKEKRANDRALAINVQAKRLAYDGTIVRFQLAINDGQMGLAESLLRPYLYDDPYNLRGIEWYYLWSQLYQVKEIGGPTSVVNALAFAADGKTLLTASIEKTVKLRELVVSTQKERGSTTLKGYLGKVDLMAFSTEGKSLATVSSGGDVKLWDVATCKQDENCKEMAMLRAQDKVTSLAFSVDSQSLATVSSDGDVKLWDLAACKEDEKCKEVATLSGDKVKAHSVAFSPDGKALATGGWDQTVKLWDVPTCKAVGTCEALATLEGHRYEVYSVAFSSDGETLATGSADFTAKLWDVPMCKKVGTCKAVATLKGHTLYLTSVAFSPDSKTLVTGSADKSARLWDVDWCKIVGICEARETLKGHIHPVTSVALSTDGTLATGSADKRAKLWIAPKRKIVAELITSPNRNDVISVVFAANGKTLATAGLDKNLGLWDVATCKKDERKCAVMSRYDGKSETRVNPVTDFPDGKTFATGSRENSAKLWYAFCEEQKCIVEVATFEGHLGPVNALASSPNGKTLVTGSQDETVKLWDVASCKGDEKCKEVATLTGHKGEVYSVAFSPDGKMLATGSEDRTVRLWNVATQTCVAKLTNDGQVFSVAFAPDGNTLAIGSQDGTVKLWAVATQTYLATLTGHIGAVNSVAFAANGTLATGSQDGTVKLWAVATQTYLATLSGHIGPVNSVAFAANGKTLATGSKDGRVELWYSATDDEIKAVQNIDTQEYADKSAETVNEAAMP